MLEVQENLNNLYLFFVCENLKRVRNYGISYNICVYLYLDIIFAVKFEITHSKITFTLTKTLVLYAVLKILYD